MTAPVRQVQVVETRIEYDVTWVDAGGVQQVRHYATIDDRDKGLEQLTQQGVSGVAVADVMPAGHL